MDSQKRTPAESRALFQRAEQAIEESRELTEITHNVIEDSQRVLADYRKFRQIGQPKREPDSK
jgi:hypothetical protein